MRLPACNPLVGGDNAPVPRSRRIRGNLNMSNEKNHYGSGIAITAGALLAMYLFFPVVFLVPIAVAEKHDWISWQLGETIEAVIIAPPSFIADRFPAYARMVNAEFAFCLRHGIPA